MALGIGKLVLVAGALASALWQGGLDAPASLMAALFVAGSGAVAVGVCQLWRQRHVYE